MSTFNTENFIQDTIRRSDLDLITNRCNLDFEQQIIEQNEPIGELDRINRRIRNLSDQIRLFRSSDSLRVSLRQSVLEQEEAIANELNEQSALIKQYLPLLSLPKTPPAAVKYLKNLALKNIFPQMRAAIRFTTRVSQLTFAVAELAQEVSEAIEYIENYARTSDDLRRAEYEAALQRLSFNLQATIQNAISESVCDNLKKNGVSFNDVSSFYDMLNDLNLTRDNLLLAEDNLRNALTSNFDQVRDLQNAMSSISEVPPVIDTSSLDAYIVSVQNGDGDLYLDQTQEVADQDPPINTEAPTIIFVGNSSPVVGNVNVLTALSATDGVWTGIIDTTKYEWYEDDVLVWEEQTYTPTANSINKSLKAVVVKENFVGIQEATSQTIANVNNPFTFVSNILAPTLSGTAQVGQTLTCSQGLWNGTSPITYSYQWEYAKTGETILGATNNQYIIDLEDVNRTLRCRVIATNLLGANSINSATSARVTN